ncbi:ABC transporter permease [Saccharothrix syringae]|uniref:ABC transporter permease n=1 Tax=Saccharothrix syringae TaxID=103733 RepID=A0A5Q0H1D5_SACSY|nr:ABC transporter permease [Saccharothrix syringae]QFZ19923.1 ABC transporter permease [Saccharothrix syringae]
MTGPGRYLARRLLQFPPTVLATLFALHYLTALGIQLNGNPARAVFGDRVPTAAQLAAAARRLGTDDPCFARVGDPCLPVFGTRLRHLLAGDLGTDVRGRDVLAAVGDAAPVTLRLALLAFAVNAAAGLTAGVLAGARRGRAADRLVRVGAAALVAVPPFLLGALAQFGLGVRLGRWLDGQPWAPQFLGDVFTVAFRPGHPWLSLVVPATVLGALAAAVTARVTRSAVAANLGADHVRTAAAKGLGRARVVRAHALRNCLVPVVTHLGSDVTALLGGAVVVEGVFNVPGAGRLVFTAVADGDAPVVIAAATIALLVHLVVNLAVDLLYPVLDPRIGHG